MTDERVFPSSKQPPTTTAAAPAAAPNGTTTAATTATTNPKTNNLYNPTTRPAPYRQPYSRHHHHHRQRKCPSGRRLCCCCCFWSILIILILALIAAIAATALYVLYHPKQPSFSVPSLRIHRLNLTTTSDSSSSHLSSLFNLTLIAENPNSHLTFSYDPFSLSILTQTDSIFLGNGSIPAFVSGENNQTAFKAVVLTSAETRELGAEEVTGLRREMKRDKGMEMKMVMDTKVEMKMGKLKSKKVGIRVTCEGIKGSIPRGKMPSLASTDQSNCKVDLRIKIWSWTF